MLLKYDVRSGSRLHLATLHFLNASAQPSLLVDNFDPNAAGRGVFGNTSCLDELVEILREI